MGSLQCVQEGILVCTPGRLAGEAALCAQDAVPCSVEKADQTQVLPFSLCMAAAVMELQGGLVFVLLVTLLVIRQLGSFAASCTHSIRSFQVMGSVRMSSRNKKSSSVELVRFLGKSLYGGCE